MKKLLALLLLVTASAVGAQTNTSFLCIWGPSTSVYTGPTNVLPAVDANYLYITTNVTLPFNQWQLLGTTPGSVIQPGNTNYVAVGSGVFTLAINYSPFYYATVVYSNSAGVSPFSLNNVGVAQGSSFPAVLKQFQKQ